MDTTPGEFRLALAPDLAAWSSDGDREAISNIRQWRPAMDKTNTNSRLLQSPRPASSRADDWRPRVAGSVWWAT